MALMVKAKRAIQDGVDSRTEFTVGNVRGRKYADVYGQLPDAFRLVIDSEKPSYVVYSYGTPIAWWSEDHGWFVPGVKYSVTTTNHQNVTRVAIDNPGFYTEAKW